jgi:hypothetical protein
MFRAISAALILTAGLPAAAQDSGGVRTRDPNAVLSQLDANRGCRMTSTSVTVGVNKATGTASAARQKMATMGGAGPSNCRPLVSTQVVTGVNMGVARGSGATQTIDATGPRGALATTTYTRGYNTAYGASSTANQRLFNQTGR